MTDDQVFDTKILASTWTAVALGWGIFAIERGDSINMAAGLSLVGIIVTIIGARGAWGKESGMKWHDAVGIAGSIFSVLFGIWAWVVLIVTTTSEMSWIFGSFFALVYLAIIVLGVILAIRKLWNWSSRLDREGR
jgi:hypothetical protein